MAYTTALEGIMKIEAGRYYKTRDGRKAELLSIDNSDWNGLPLKVKYPTGNLWLNKDGIMQMPRDPDDDLIAEWTADEEPTGPVRTVTRKEIVPGEYGDVQVTGSGNIVVVVKPDSALIRAAIATLTEIAEALEDR